MPRYTATIRGTTFAGSLADLSTAYSRLRDQSGEGASTFPTATVLDERNHTAGFIGYNGRIWADHPADWNPNATPIYDNRVEG